MVSGFVDQTRRGVPDPDRTLARDQRRRLQGFNFINILRAAFLYKNDLLSFSLILEL